MTKRSLSDGDDSFSSEEPPRGPNLLPAADLAAEIDRLQEQLRHKLPASYRGGGKKASRFR